LDVMEAAMSGKGGRKDVIERTTAEDIFQRLDASISKNAQLSSYAGDPEIWSTTRSYVGDIVADLVNQRHIARIPRNIVPYLAPLLKTGNADTIAEELRQYFADEDERKFGVPPKDDDDEVEIVNANFSLGYGGMLLLSHTNLKLLKGHRYGLCGRNGAGKSTLMRSIADGKLEGFPSPEEVRTCFVEHNQGEDAEISILEYCFKDPKLAPEGNQNKLDHFLVDGK